jgi:hypothetical protein
VYRNGVKLGTADFTATNGTSVVLANACAAGDYVRFEGFLITTFNNAIANTNGAVGASLLATGAAATNIGTAGVTQTMLANNVGSTGPAVFAYGTTNAQTIATSTITKIIFNGKIFDTNNCFDSTTNYRFTPNVAGYYQISFTTQFDYIGSWRAFVYLYKNGSNFLFQEQPNGMAASTYPSLTLNPVLVYANGTTDYFEIYVEQRSGGNQGSYGGGSVPPYSTFFSANMVRAA